MYLRAAKQKNQAQLDALNAGLKACDARKALIREQLPSLPTPLVSLVFAYAALVQQDFASVSASSSSDASAANAVPVNASTPATANSSRHPLARREDIEQLLKASVVVAPLPKTASR